MAPKKRSSPSLTSSRRQQPHFDHVHSFQLPLQQQPDLLPDHQSRHPRHSLDHLDHQPRDDSSSSSFFHPSLQAPPVDPALQPLHPPAVAASPVPSSEGTAPESSSRRQSTSSTMRTSSIPLDGAPSSTPTGRISKAKKGKRVHACAYDGCGKVRPTDGAVSLTHRSPSHQPGH